MALSPSPALEYVARPGKLLMRLWLWRKTDMSRIARRVRRTHFCLIPVVRNDDSQDETVRMGGSAMRVLHHRDGGGKLWLHDTGVEKEGRRTSTNVMERGGQINRRFAFAQNQLDQDALEFKPVSNEEVTELAQIAGTIDVLELYCTNVLGQKPRHHVQKSEAQQVLGALTELIFANLETADRNADHAVECKGVPNML